MNPLPTQKLSFTQINSHSWFDINVVKTTNKKSVNNLPSDTMKKTELIRTKKIQIFFNEKQKKIINKWFDIYRYVYNETLFYVKKNKDYNFNRLRKIIKNNFNQKMKNKIKNSKIPSHTIDYAIKNVTSAFSSNFTKLTNKDISRFRMRYKKLKNPKQILTLEDSCFSMSKYKKSDWYINNLFEGYNFDDLNNTFCSSVFGNYIKTSEPINRIEKTCVLSYNKNKDEYILNVPYTEVQKVKENIDNRDVCSIDPGVRTFLTIYSPTEIISIGNNAQELINKGLDKIDILRSKIDLKRNEIKQNKNKKLINDLIKLKKRYCICYDKLKNQIKDLHYKSISFIKNRYKVVLLGNMSTKSTTSKDGDLPEIVKRQLYTLKHYSFHLLLKYKSEIENIYYSQVDESYTSKTCGNCNNVKKEQNKSKVYNCSKCGIKVDRDINGAYNILKKHVNLVSKFFI